jgi:hypothetical protein
MPLPMNQVMSLDAVLTRISQIDALMTGATPATASATAATSAATASAATTTTAGTGATSFVNALQSAVSPALTTGTAATGAVSSTGSSVGAEMVQIAQSQIGQTEQPPGSNDGPAIAAYRTATTGAAAGEPWCAYFASWVAKQAGEPLGSQGQGLGYVGDIWSWAKQTGRAITNGPGVVPSPGDLIVFGDHHVGVVQQVLPDGRIETIEGNYENKVSQVIRSPGEATGYVQM